MLEVSLMFFAHRAVSAYQNLRFFSIVFHTNRDAGFGFVEVLETYDEDDGKMARHAKAEVKFRFGELFTGTLLGVLSMIRYTFARSYTKKAR